VIEMSETMQSAAIPEDVRAFAREQGVEAELPAVLEAARRLLPGVSGVRCLLEEDPEVMGLRHIVVIVQGTDPDAKSTLQVYTAWAQALFAIVGSRRVCTFQLEVERPS
jgi:hypothetical protein